MTGKTGCGAAGRAMTALLCAAALTVYGAAAAQAVPAPAADSSYSDADGTTWYVYTTNRSADIAGQSGDHIQIGSGSGAGPQSMATSTALPAMPVSAAALFP